MTTQMTTVISDDKLQMTTVISDDNPPMTTQITTPDDNPR
jgi:hypothetical protein